MVVKKCIRTFEKKMTLRFNLGVHISTTCKNQNKIIMNNYAYKTAVVGKTIDNRKIIGRNSAFLLQRLSIAPKCDAFTA